MYNYFRRNGWEAKMYNLAEVGPTEQELQSSLATWEKAGKDMGKLLRMLGNEIPFLGYEVEFGCYEQLDATVDIVVTFLESSGQDSWKIQGRWMDLSGKPPVAIEYNTKTKIGIMYRI